MLQKFSQPNVLPKFSPIKIFQSVRVFDFCLKRFAAKLFSTIYKKTCHQSVFTKVVYIDMGDIVIIYQKVVLSLWFSLGVGEFGKTGCAAAKLRHFLRHHPDAVAARSANDDIVAGRRIFFSDLGLLQKRR